jgi:hypothetical protein
MSYITFKSKYVLHTFPDYSTNPEPSIYSPNSWLRNPMGVDARLRINDYPKFQIKNKYSFVTAQGISDFNDLFDFCHGRVGTLWVPSWNQDFFLISNIVAGNNYVDIKDYSYSTYYPSIPGTGRYIFIYINSTHWYAREVLSVYSPTRLVVDNSFDVDISMAQVKYVCILYLCRFDLDTLEWTFIVPMVAETTTEFIEVPHEYASLT